MIDLDEGIVLLPESHGAAAPAPGFSAVRIDRPETKKNWLKSELFLYTLHSCST